MAYSLISLIPLVALLFMLAALRMTAWLASILAGIITIPLGVLVWHAPLREHIQILSLRRAYGVLGDRLDHVLGPDYLQHSRFDRDFSIGSRAG